MALSDYLTDEEWDGFYYASYGKHQAESLGASMHKSIDALLAAGYEFQGLDKNGEKKQQLPSSNPEKFVMVCGLTQMNKKRLLEILKNGREFWKKNLPAVLTETDDEWDSMLKGVVI